MSSSSAGSRTRPSCTACRPPWTHVIAVSWRNCSPTCLPGGSGCWPGSEPPCGEPGFRWPTLDTRAGIEIRRSGTAGPVRSPGPAPATDPAPGPGSGPCPGPGPGAVPGQFNRAAGPAATPAPLFFPPGRGDRFTIGRTRDCDLCLADLSVARRHAELVRGAGGWLLNDL